MLTSELIKKVRKIEIKTKRIVDELTGGAYHSTFKGQGIEFDEVREYTLEDDVRDIDWNVTARMGQPYIKKFVEERELTVTLLVDASSSSFLRSAAGSKQDKIAEIAALLAFSAIRNNDRVGLLIFTDSTELYLPPRAGRKHGLRLIRELLAFEPEKHGTSINNALREINRVLPKRSVIFVLSDFLDSDNYDTALRILNRKHDVIAVRVHDELEKRWLFSQSIVLENSETGESVIFNGRFGRKKALTALFDKNRNDVEKVCRQAKVDIIDIANGEDILKPLMTFFNNRKKR